MLVPYVFLCLGILVAIYIFLNQKNLVMDILPPPVIATDVLTDNLKDPLITSRAYFTEPATGPIGDFVGYSPVSQDDWLHSFSHEKS